SHRRTVARTSPAYCFASAAKYATPALREKSATATSAPPDGSRRRASRMKSGSVASEQRSDDSRSAYSLDPNATTAARETMRNPGGATWESASGALSRPTTERVIRLLATASSSSHSAGLPRYCQRRIAAPAAIRATMARSGSSQRRGASRLEIIAGRRGTRLEEVPGRGAGCRGAGRGGGPTMDARTDSGGAGVRIASPETKAFGPDPAPPSGLIPRPAAGYVEDRTGVEAARVGAEPGDELRDLLRQAQPLHRALGDHR